MKILVFTYSVTRCAGGVFDAVRDLFINEVFYEHNIKIEIISFLDNYVTEDISKWNGIPIILFKAGPMLYSKAARNALINADADILHMEGLWRYPQILMGVWKKHRKDPIVCSPHGMLDPYIIQSQGKIKRIISKQFFQNSLEGVDCFHALCKKELQDIRDYGLKQPVAIIPNGVNLPQEDRSYEVRDDKKHLLYLGRLHPKKGIDLLIKAIAEIKVHNMTLLKNWVVDVVGWDHENTKASLLDLVKKYQLEKNIIFHGGLFEDDKVRMYATSSAYILPSHGEGLPMTVLEAWSWKLPVLMTDYCNLPEGFECDAAIKLDTNVDAVKNGIEKLFQMTDSELKQMGNNGYKLVKNQFTWDMSAKNMSQLYQWLLFGGHKPEFVFE